MGYSHLLLPSFTEPLKFSSLEITVAVKKKKINLKNEPKEAQMETAQLSFHF